MKKLTTSSTSVTTVASATTVTASTIQSIITLHEQMRGSYFYSSPGNAAGRRSYERKHSMIAEFDYDGQHVEVVQDTSCSCKNVYYHMSISIDGQRTSKDLRYIKKILKFLTEQAAA